MNIVPYVHSPDRHEGFVLASFCLQTCEPDSTLRDLIKDGARILVAEAPSAKRSDGSPVYYGWAGVHRGALIHCYVRHDLRKFPVIPRLLEELKLESPIAAMFPTRQLRAIARAWNLTIEPWVDPEVAN